MLNLRRHARQENLVSISEIDIESEGKVLNLRRLRNRKIFVTSERSGGGRNRLIVELWELVF